MIGAWFCLEGLTGLCACALGLLLECRRVGSGLLGNCAGFGRRVWGFGLKKCICTLMYEPD